MRAVMTNPEATPRLLLREVPEPVPGSNEALVKVQAFSLNAGETRMALEATKNYAPGWDFAGVVEVAAADGSSPGAGVRVVGFVPQGAWSEKTVVRGGQVVEIPSNVSFAEAAALPVAGVTAMLCFEKAGALLGRRVLITGAAGGVGRFACQLAAIGGAHLFAVSRRPTLVDQLRGDNVACAGIFTTMAGAKAAGFYDVILDSVGGETLGLALTALAPGGICVNCGNSTRRPTSFDALEFYRVVGGGRLHSVWLGSEPPENCRIALTRLAKLVAEGRLHMPIGKIAPWTEVDAAAACLVGQEVDGKIIMTIT
jgi:NADPH:quinone reductase